MAKFKNNLAIQNILGGTQSHGFNNKSTSKSRNAVPSAATHHMQGPQFKTTAAAVGLSLGSTKGIGKTMIMAGNASTTTGNQVANLFFAAENSAKNNNILNSATSHGKRVSGSTNINTSGSNNKFNQTIVGVTQGGGMYSMMY